MIQWWDDQATLCQSFLNNSRPFISVGSGLRAEVVSGSTHPTGAFTSKLTLNVSTERNGSKVGCTRSPSTSCTPSNTDPNIFEFQILVKDCSEISGIIIVWKFEWIHIDSLIQVVAHITYIIYGILKTHSIICIGIEFTYCLCTA